MTNSVLDIQLLKILSSQWLLGVWITNKQTKFLPLDQFKVYHPSFALRQKMLNLIQNLSYYMSVEVVEPAWHTLAEDIASCSTVYFYSHWRS